MRHSLYCCFLFLLATSSWAQDHVRLSDGTGIRGHVDWYHKGSITLIKEDGTKIKIKVTRIDNIMFAEPKAPADVEKPPIAMRPNQIQEYRNTLNVKAPTMPAGLSLAYVCRGVSDIERNSQPFKLTEPSVLFLAFKPNGIAPLLHLSTNRTNESSQVTGDSIGSDDFGEGKTLFASKLSYDRGAGNAYARVTANSCEWLVAVVNADHIPTRQEIEIAGASILKFANWRQIELQK